jgi:hypothetical protein
LFARNWSWLLSEEESYPKFLPTPSSNANGTPPDTKLSVVENLPTRSQIREWLVNPPPPPFTIAIAVSGQKHIFPFRREAISQEIFPVLLEEDLLYLERSRFIDALAVYEELMSLGFSKTEIDSGDYRSDRLMICLKRWGELEGLISPIRGTLLAILLGYVAIKQEE